MQAMQWSGVGDALLLAALQASILFGALVLPLAETPQLRQNRRDSPGSRTNQSKSELTPSGTLEVLKSAKVLGTQTRLPQRGSNRSRITSKFLRSSV